MAADSGTTDIVATPHNNLEFAYDQESINTLFQELSDKAAGMINLHLGCDFHLNVDNVHDALANPAKYTINGKGYLMVGIAGFNVNFRHAQCPESDARNSYHAHCDSSRTKSFSPGAAKGSRNLGARRLLDASDGTISDWAVWFAFSTICGVFDELDLVHFVASDAHDTKDRVPVLAPTYKLVAQRWGREKADSLFIHNPSAALFGEPIYALPRPKKSFIFSFLRR